jgi:hypothetical protein
MYSEGSCLRHVSAPQFHAADFKSDYYTELLRRSLLCFRQNGHLSR